MKFLRYKVAGLSEFLESSFKKALILDENYKDISNDLTSEEFQNIKTLQIDDDYL